MSYLDFAYPALPDQSSDFTESGSGDKLQFYTDLDTIKKENKTNLGFYKYFFEQKYSESEKFELKDGPHSYFIPYPSRVDGNQNSDHYFFLEKVKIREEKVATWFVPVSEFSVESMIKKAKEEYPDYIRHELWIPDWVVNKDKMMDIYINIMDKKYIEINSPMTIKGGDVAGQNGYSEKSNFPVDHEDIDEYIDKWVEKSGYQRGRSIYFHAFPNALILKENSGYNKDLDFKNVYKLSPDTIYNIDGIFYNSNEAGNFWYGYTLAALGISEADVELIAHEGTIKLTSTRSYDEPWELDALLDGWRYYGIFKLGSAIVPKRNIFMYANPTNVD